VPLEPEHRARRRTFWTVALIAAVVIAWLLWWQWGTLTAAICGSPSREVPEPAATETGPAGAGGANQPEAREAAVREAERLWTDWLGRAPVWPDDFAEPRDCRIIEEDMSRLCRRLDEGAGGESSPGSCALIDQAAERLGAHPPDLTSELRSYETILENVHHLFRTVGAKRLDSLRRLARDERDHAEIAAFVLFRWLASREACARSGRPPIDEDALYAYAGFVFETMGGQAYLRRRSPRVEAMASFYALVVLDRAIERGHNPAGVDPRPDIARTRELLEGRAWVFGDRYRAVLEEMERRFKERELPH
jgi:hypothetical protein